MEEKIVLGNAIEEGEVQDTLKGIPLAHFLNSMLIAGVEGTGKSYFFAHILDQLYKRYPMVGVLVIRTSKNSPTHINYIFLSMKVYIKKEAIYPRCNNRNN